MAGTKFYTADSFIKEGGTSSQFLKADGSVDTNTYATTSSQLSTEEIQDVVGAMVSGNTETNISVTYNDTTGKLNFASTDTNTNTQRTDEEIRDVAAAQWVNGTNTTVVVDDASNTIKINATDTNTQRAIHDTPVNGATTTSISSNWAFDNVKTAVPSGALFTDTNTTYVSSDFNHDDLTGFVANEHIDWTIDQGATNIHVNNVSGYLKDTTDIFTGTLTVEGGSLGVDEGEKIILDKDGDSFANIFYDVNGTMKMIYNSVNQHHFKNGEDGQYDVVKAGSFVKDGGTSSQFLKADGSVDSNSYSTFTANQSLDTTSNPTFGNVSIGQFLYHSGDADTYIRYDSNKITLRVNGSDNMYYDGTYNQFQKNVRLVDNGTDDAFIGVFNGGSASSTTTSTIMVGEFGNTPKIWLRNYRDGSGSQELGYAGTFRVKSGQIGSSTTRLTMTSGGDATFVASVTSTNFITSSDSRLKDNVEVIGDSHIDVDWKTFELKSNMGQKRYGVIAQELEEKHPEFVRTNDEGMKSVAYMDLLIAKIAELEARLEKVENK